MCHLTDGAQEYFRQLETMDRMIGPETVTCNFCKHETDKEDAGYHAECGDWYCRYCLKQGRVLQQFISDFDDVEAATKEHNGILKSLK